MPIQGDCCYTAPSLHGQAAQLQFRLHREQKQQPEAKRQKVDETAAEVSSNQQMLQQMQLLVQQHQQQTLATIQNLNTKPIDVLPEEKEVPITGAVQPYGRALNAQRLKYRDSIQRYFFSLGMCSSDKPPPADIVKSVFHQLGKQRSGNKLPEGAEWFARDVTFFRDEN